MLCLQLIIFAICSASTRTSSLDDWWSLQKRANYSNTFKRTGNKVSLLITTDNLQQMSALSTLSATRKFYDYFLRMPNVNAHHLYLNNNNVIAWRRKWNHSRPKWCTIVAVQLHNSFGFQLSLCAYWKNSLGIYWTPLVLLATLAHLLPLDTFFRIPDYYTNAFEAGAPPWTPLDIFRWGKNKGGNRGKNLEG